MLPFSGCNLYAQETACKSRRAQFSVKKKIIFYGQFNKKI